MTIEIPDRPEPKKWHKWGPVKAGIIRAGDIYYHADDNKWVRLEEGNGR